MLFINTVCDKDANVRKSTKLSHMSLDVANVLHMTEVCCCTFLTTKEILGFGYIPFLVAALHTRVFDEGPSTQGPAPVPVYFGLTCC